MKRLWWELEHALPHLGVPGLLGLALLVTALVVGFVVSPPLQRQRIELDAETARISLKPLRTSPLVVEVDELESLTPVREVPQRLQEIISHAAREGLRVPRGQYQAQKAEPGGLPLVRYTITLPLTGGYTAVRTFAERARRDVPGLALTQLSFSRESIQAAEALSTVEFTLWLTEDAQ